VLQEGLQVSNAFVGEVRLVGFNFAPFGWSLCNGALITISDYPALFNLIGTTYGGDGQTTFQLPDLRSRIPIHQGSNGTNIYVLGQTAGAESVTVGISQFPSHNHVLQASTASGGSNTPLNNAPASLDRAYSGAAPLTAMSPNMLTFSGGGGQPHENRQPYLALNWVICLNGIYPTQT
jgi:microcystin-dependent protein